MDTDSEDRLVKNVPEPHDPSRLVDKGEIENSIELWEQALSTSLPQASRAGPEEREARRTVLPAPLRAPLADDLEIEPTRVERRDGFVPAPTEALRSRLRSAAFDRIQVEVPVRLPDRKQKRPARRVYFFDQPVDAVGNSAGTIYALGENGGLVPFDGGSRARRLVEVIEEDAFEEPPGQEETLSATVRSGIARWSRG